MVGRRAQILSAYRTSDAILELFEQGVRATESLAD